MDLYVTGQSPLIQPAACRRWYTDKSNPCNHVPSGAVDASEPGNEACPLMATSPKVVLSNASEMSIQEFAAENILRLRRGSEAEFIHCRDGYDRTLEQNSIAELRKHFKDEDIQDIWDEGPAISDWSDLDDLDLFGDDYPRGPVANLGVISRNGAIYRITQEPFNIQELTTSNHRRPFTHAIFRQECNNGKKDVWPTLVFSEQPNVLYRVPTIADLLNWLQGQSIEYRRICLASPIVKLCARRGRGEQCAALTEDGKVYYWNRDSMAGVKDSKSLEGTLKDPPTLSDSFYGHDVDGAIDSPIGRMDIPPVSTIALGQSMGSAVTREGALYVFDLMRSGEGQSGKHTPHITDLDDGTSNHVIARPFEAQLASIHASLGSVSESVKFIDTAAGNDHLVALTSEGRVFTVGNGFQGALGIGERQFKLDDSDPKSFEWSPDSTEYAEDWQQLDISQLLTHEGRETKKRIVKVGAGYESTLLVSNAG